jgi:hypothetical protein
MEAEEVLRCKEDAAHAVFDCLRKRCGVCQGGLQKKCCKCNQMVSYSNFAKHAKQCKSKKRAKPEEEKPIVRIAYVSSAWNLGDGVMPSGQYCSKLHEDFPDHLQKLDLSDPTGDMVIADAYDAIWGTMSASGLCELVKTFHSLDEVFDWHDKVDLLVVGNWAHSAALADPVRGRDLALALCITDCKSWRFEKACASSRLSTMSGILLKRFIITISCRACRSQAKCTHHPHDCSFVWANVEKEAAGVCRKARSNGAGFEARNERNEQARQKNPCERFAAVRGTNERVPLDGPACVGGVSRAARVSNVCHQRSVSLGCGDTIYWRWRERCGPSKGGMCSWKTNVGRWRRKRSSVYCGTSCESRLCGHGSLRQVSSCGHGEATRRKWLVDQRA